MTARRRLNVDAALELSGWCAWKQAQHFRAKLNGKEPLDAEEVAQLVPLLRVLVETRAALRESVERIEAAKALGLENLSNDDLALELARSNDLFRTVRGRALLRAELDEVDERETAHERGGLTDDA